MYINLTILFFFILVRHLISNERLNERIECVSREVRNVRERLDRCARVREKMCGEKVELCESVCTDKVNECERVCADKVIEFRICTDK